MVRVRVAKIEVFVENCRFSAQYLDEAEGCGESDDDDFDYLEEAVHSAVENAKRALHDETLLLLAETLARKAKS